MTNRNHPVRVILDAAACGHKPNRAELSELEALGGEGVPGRWVSAEVKKAAERVVAIRRDGHMLGARREAASSAEQIVSRLPEYEEAVERDLPDDPRALADIVRGDGPDAKALRKEIENIPRV